LASRASEAFVAQTADPQADAASCESVKDDLLHDLSQLELKGSEELQSAKSSLEKGPCDKTLFAATLYLRSADSLN
jgi:hypothetical protein